MKQALQLKLGQQLALTPQLQQAIKLLQLSTADLQQALEETLESNALPVQLLRQFFSFLSFLGIYLNLS